MNTQNRRAIVKGVVGSIALLAICFVLIADQKPNNSSKSNLGRESDFLHEISQGNGLNGLLEASAHTKLDSV